MLLWHLLVVTNIDGVLRPILVPRDALNGADICCRCSPVSPCSAPGVSSHRPGADEVGLIVTTIDVYLAVYKASNWNGSRSTTVRRRWLPRRGLATSETPRLRQRWVRLSCGQRGLRLRRRRQRAELIDAAGTGGCQLGVPARSVKAVSSAPPARRHVSSDPRKRPSRFAAHVDRPRRVHRRVDGADQLVLVGVALGQAQISPGRADESHD